MTGALRALGDSHAANGEHTNVVVTGALRALGDAPQGQDRLADPTGHG